MADTDLKLIFNALVSNPAWRTNVTNFSSYGQQQVEMAKIPKEDLMAWVRGGMVGAPSLGMDVCIYISDIIQHVIYILYGYMNTICNLCSYVSIWLYATRCKLYTYI